VNRRKLITLLGGAAAAWPLAARAQQRVTSPRRIGVLLVGLSPESKQVKQFRLGLRDAGYSEGRDVVIEWRSASGDYDRVPALVADLIQKKVEVIVQDSTVGTEVTKRATSTIPIVMADFHERFAGPCRSSERRCGFFFSPMDDSAHLLH
jgi:putative tryptophan/tyrosine transport system substrate-binding protein